MTSGPYPQIAGRRLLERIGPALVGLPHFFTYWATREVDDVTQDELLSEFAANTETLWRDEVTARTGGSATEEVT